MHSMPKASLPLLFSFAVLYVHRLHLSVGLIAGGRAVTAWRQTWDHAGDLKYKYNKVISMFFFFFIYSFIQSRDKQILVLLMWWWSDAAIGVFNSLIKCLASRRKAQEKKAHATIPMLSWITKEKILRKKKGYRYSYHQEVKEWWHLLATQKEGESHNKWSDALQVVVLIPLTNQETPQNHTIILPKNEKFFFSSWF